MTLQELDAMQEDTRRLPRVADRVEQLTAVALIEIARQLVILNAHLEKGEKPKAKAAKSGR